MSKFSLPQLPTGYEFYRGPSLINGEEIIGIAILRSHNRKTGDIQQTFILRADMNPLEAVDQNLDDAICGNCFHRGIDGNKRTCYVNIGQAPNQIYKAWLNSKYPKEPSLLFAKNKIIRIGSYGDPSAIPYDIWKKITENARAWTGYTSRWRDIDPIYSNLLMASVSNRREFLEAKCKGYRTFRVRKEGASLYKREFDCPASEESGKRLTCEECLACCGTHNEERKLAGDVSITIHGRLRNNFNENKNKSW